MDVKAKSHAEAERWICIYPLYINSKKTVVQGRQILQSRAVENPTAQEIYDVIDHAGLPCKIEKKMHPRDPNRDANMQGRVRVQIKNEDGSLLNEKFPTRKAIMYYACDMIPKLKSRQPGATSAQATSQNSGGKQKKKK